MTQDIYKVITQDLLEHRIVRSILEPLPLSDLIAQTLIIPLGVLFMKNWKNKMSTGHQTIYLTILMVSIRQPPPQQQKTYTSIEPQNINTQMKTGIHNTRKDKAPILLIYHQSGEIQKTRHKQCHNNHYKWTSTGKMTWKMNYPSQVEVKPLDDLYH